VPFELQTGRWWDADEASLPNTLSGWASHLESFDFERRSKNLIFARLATNRDLPNIYGLSLTRTNMRALDFRDWKAPVFNVTGSSIETLVNKVGRNKPWVLFLTDGGDFSARMAGKRRSRFVDGVFHETGTYKLTRQMFQDGLTYGDGFIKATKSLDGKSIVHDVVLADELLIDPWDSLYFGKWPRSLIHRTFVNRSDLLAIFGDDEQARFAIETAPGSFQGPMWGGMSSNAQSAMVALLEAWKLPDADGTPGRHVMCVSDRLALVDEPYKRKKYPFVKFSCVSAGRGFWNIGIPEILGPFQANINRTQQVIDDCQRRMSTGRWLVPTGSGVTDDALASKAAGIIRHNPNLPPQFVVPQAVPGDLYAHLDKTIERAYKRVGISELAAQAMKPAGLNSGEALRAFESAESERYVTLGMQLEEAVVDLAELDLELAEEIRPTVRAPRSGGIDVIDWSELEKIKETRAVMKAFPISSLPTSPAGRLQRAAEMFQIGQITKEDYLRIIDYPDTQAVIDLQTAARDSIDWMLDRIVEEGIPEMPEPYQPLDVAIQVCQNRYLRERTLGCPEERLELLRRFMDAAKTLQQKIASGGTMGAPNLTNAQQTGAALPQPPGGLPPPVAPVIGQGAAGGDVNLGPVSSSQPLPQAA
jgi:hypothetical protein